MSKLSREARRYIALDLLDPTDVPEEICESNMALYVAQRVKESIKENRDEVFMTWGIKPLDRDMIYDVLGFRPVTDFYEAIQFVEPCGASYVKGVFLTALYNWCEDYKFATELSVILGIKILEYRKICCKYYDEESENMFRAYINFWKQARKLAKDTLKGDDLSYFCSITDGFEKWLAQPENTLIVRIYRV